MARKAKFYIKRTFLDLPVALLAGILIGLLHIPPFQVASRWMGKLARFVGPLLPTHRVAEFNIRRALPHLTSARHQEILAASWESLGRTIAEYMRLSRIPLQGPDSPIEVQGYDVVDALIHDGKPAVLVTAHLANWELATFVALRGGLKITQLYRKLNNPLVDRMIQVVHRRVTHEVITKGPDGAKRMLQVLRQGGHVAMLNDQKLREGDLIPFFGYPAKTASAGARLAIKYDCPFVPVRVERLDGTPRFRVTYYPPLQPRIEGDLNAQTQDLLIQMNALFEEWIRARPEDWFWQHRRWHKDEYRALK
ncbi:MAG: lysophospholipid acyltransferase family protein [Holosporales bacterium]